MTLPIQDANSFRLQWRYRMVINIIAKVAQALKDIGETSHYQRVLQTLQCLLVTIQYLHQMQTKCTDPYLMDAIQTLTATAEKPILDFMEDVQNSDNILKAGETPRSLKARVLEGSIDIDGRKEG